MRWIRIHLGIESRNSKTLKIASSAQEGLLKHYILPRSGFTEVQEQNHSNCSKVYNRRSDIAETVTNVTSSNSYFEKPDWLSPAVAAAGRVCVCDVHPTIYLLNQWRYILHIIPGHPGKTKKYKKKVFFQYLSDIGSFLFDSLEMFFLNKKMKK